MLYNPCYASGFIYSLPSVLCLLSLFLGLTYYPPACLCFGASLACCCCALPSGLFSPCLAEQWCSCPCTFYICGGTPAAAFSSLLNECSCYSAHLSWFGSSQLIWHLCFAFSCSLLVWFSAGQRDRGRLLGLALDSHRAHRAVLLLALSCRTGKGRDTRSSGLKSLNCQVWQQEWKQGFHLLLSHHENAMNSHWSVLKALSEMGLLHRRDLLEEATKHQNQCVGC